MTYVDLEVVSLDAAPLPQPLSQRFDEAGGTIGRDPSNTLVLTDRHRRVSRLHGRVLVDGSGARILNESTSLPITVDDVQIEYGRVAALRNGAAIEIGPFVLRAMFQASAPPDLAVTPLTSTPSTPPVPPAPQPPLVTPPPMAAPSPLPQPPAIPVAPEPAALSTPLPSAQPLDVDRLFGGGAGIDLAAAAPVPDLQAAPGADGSVRIEPTFSAADIRLESADPFADLLGEPKLQRRADTGLPGAIESPVSSQPVAPAASADRLPPMVAAPPAVAPADQDLLDLLSPSRPPMESVSVAPSAFQPVLPPRDAALPGSNLIPEDFNPFDLPSSDSRNAVDPLAQLSAGPFPPGAAAGSAGLPTETSIDALFLSPAGADADLLSSSAPLSAGHLDPFRDLLPGDGSTDPLAGLGVAAPAPVAAPVRDDALLLNENLAVGPARSAVRPPDGDPLAPAQAKGAVPAPPAMSGETDAGRLAAAFLHGAGLPASALPQGLTPELMALVGAVLRNATAGAVDLLAARAATKREVQATVTIISAQANNPLKFVPNADAALQQMLGKRIPGFMRADQAMRDAFDDLRAHEIGVIAGTRAALEEVLANFDPARIGQKLTKASLADSLMPAARKAKLWDLFVERYEQIRQEAVDDFHTVFGRAFVRAYEQEAERMNRQGNGDAPP